MVRNHLRLALVLIALTLPSFAAVARTSSCTGTSSCTPANGNGDLQVAFACVNLTSTAPTNATGWTSVGTATINGTSTADSACRVSCKVSTGASEASNTFTSATSLNILTYSGVASGNTASCATNIVTSSTFTTTINTTPTSATWNAVTNVDSNSWDAGFIYAPAATAGLTTNVPGGMTNVTSAGTVMAAHDTNAATASFTTTSTSWTTGSRGITAVVQIKSACADICVKQSASSGSLATATLSAVTAGNALVVFCNWEGTNGNATASDGTASFTMCSTIQNPTATQENGQFGYLLSGTGSATTITCTNPGGSSSPSTIAWEVEHPGGSVVFDVCGTGSADSGTAVATGSFTTSIGASGGIVFAGEGNFAANALTSPLINGAAADASLLAVGGNQAAGWYKKQTSAFTGTASGTITSTAWVIGALALKISAGGGGATVPLCTMSLMGAGPC